MGERHHLDPPGAGLHQPADQPHPWLLVDRTTGSFWSPSRGLTSTIVSWRIRRSPLVRRAGGWAEFGMDYAEAQAAQPRSTDAPPPGTAIIGTPGRTLRMRSSRSPPSASGLVSLRAVRPQRPGLPRRLHLGPLVRARRARGHGGGLGLRGVRAGAGGEPVRRRPGGLRAGRGPGGQGGWRGRVAAPGPRRAGRLDAEVVARLRRVAAAADLYGRAMHAGLAALPGRRTRSASSGIACTILREHRETATSRPA